MKWENKASIMRTCSRFPFGDKLYKLLQKKFGRLNADPVPRLKAQKQIAEWLLKNGAVIKDKNIFEIGTGHKPVVPIGFYLSGAKSVITVDLHRRLDYDLTQKSLWWIANNLSIILEMYRDIADTALLEERLILVKELWSKPEIFLSEANIQYLAPVDASHVDLPDGSIDYHFSITTLEHIPYEALNKIFIEAKRILSSSGYLIHSIDMSDHFQHQDSSITPINFLRYSNEEWAGIAGNEFAYCNRLRVNDYLALFSDLEFEVVKFETDTDNQSKLALNNGFPLDHRFTSYSIDDICTRDIKILLKMSTLANVKKNS